jgi:NADH:ubiquinone oxidoreductase subunit 2 (subunit N)
LFSLAGLPPAITFLFKGWLFLQTYWFNNFFLLFVIFASSFLNLAYYIRLARFVLFPAKSQKKEQVESFEPLSSIYVCILLCIFFLNLAPFILFSDLGMHILEEIIKFLSGL